MSENTPPLSIAIQAGGESRRMGRDKGLVAFLGQPLVARLVERMRPAADELLVTTNNPAGYAFLGLPTFSDLVPDVGALGGLYTALSAAKHPLVGVVACDMPFASPTLLQALAAALLREGADLAVPRSEGGLEPFHAVYRRNACMPHIETALEAGKRRVDAWFHAVSVLQFPWAQVLEIDPNGRAFMNVNTPQELAAAEKLARQA